MSTSKLSEGLQIQERIRKPMNPFKLWSRERRRKIAAENPEMYHFEISVRLGSEWRSMSGELKRPFFIEAERLRQEHLKKRLDNKYLPIRKQRVTEKRDMIITANNTQSYTIPYSLEDNDPSNVLKKQPGTYLPHSKRAYYLNIWNRYWVNEFFYPPTTTETRDQQENSSVLKCDVIKNQNLQLPTNKTPFGYPEVLCPTSASFQPQPAQFAQLENNSLLSNAGPANFPSSYFISHPLMPASKESFNQGPILRGLLLNEKQVDCQRSDFSSPRMYQQSQFNDLQQMMYHDAFPLISDCNTQAGTYPLDSSIPDLIRPILKN